MGSVSNMATESLKPLPLPPGIKESYLQSHDLNYHILTAGSPTKPLLLLLHGFPELAFSWRKVMNPLAEKGYFVVAYDQRGYGRTTGWDTRPFHEVDLHTFSFVRLVRDAVILVNALGYNEVSCVIGHDFGGAGAAMCALARPDIFKSVIMMSHPFNGTPKLPFNILNGNQEQPKPKGNIHAELAKLDPPRKHYKWYNSTAPANEEMTYPKEGLHSFLRGYFHLKSADWEGNNPHKLAAWSGPEVAKMPYYYIMPLSSNMREAVSAHMSTLDPETVAQKSARWLPDSDLAVYSENWGRNGFQGGLNWYRVATTPSIAKDLESWAGMKIEVPSLYVGGKSDWGTFQQPGAIENMDSKRSCADHRGTILIEGAGHWVQQERPERVVEEILKFLGDTKGERGESL